MFIGALSLDILLYNIHRNGTAAVEAGAYIADVIQLILKQKVSGIDLVK